MCPRGKEKKISTATQFFVFSFFGTLTLFFQPTYYRSDSYRDDVPLEISMRRHAHNGATSNSRQMEQNI